VRYNYGWFDAFAEVATSQNYDRFGDNAQRWGVGVIAGSRFYPTDGVLLIALYRYYSPWFDNEQGYAFSETSRINDENGGYLGFDITRLRNWRFLGYGDVFYFSGYKYGLGNDTCTLGYDAMAEVQYHSTNHQLPITNDQYWLSLRARARKKGASTYSIRAIFDWQRNGWSLRTTADANYVESYGVSLAQDIAYDFQSPMSNIQCPITLRVRMQFFDARDWTNRIYLYEHDVLYAFSIPATYGLGGRAYLCLKWQIIKQLAIYLRVSETVYDRKWYMNKHPKWDGSKAQIPTRTDVHFLLRATL
jgi:opacity protein-like surface antigen